MKLWIYICIPFTLMVFCIKKPAVIEKSHEDTVFHLNEPLPNDPSAIFGKLDNGLRYIIRVNREPKCRAELRLVVKVGSVLEEAHEKGLAHFCEHMAFNSTRHFDKETIARYLESTGMRFGPDISAYTGFDETVFMLELPADSLEIMETGFQILADWAHCIQFESKEIDQERNVILDEWCSGRGAGARIRDRQLPVLYFGSKYADRLPMGDPAVIDTFHFQTLRQFYKNWYRPDLMAVIAVGDFDPSWIAEKIRCYFKGIVNPQNREPRPYASIPDHSDIKVSIATDPEATQTQINLNYKYNFLPKTTVSDYRRTIAETLYNHMFNKRLTQLVNSEDPPCLAVFSGHSHLTPQKGVYTLNAFVDNSEIPRGLEVMLREVRRVRQFGFTETELEKAKMNVLRNIEKAVQERDKIESSEYISEYVQHFANSEPVPGILHEYRLFQQFGSGISLQAINELVEEQIGNGNLVILLSGSDESSLFFPDESSILQIYNDIQTMEIAAYEEKTDDQMLLLELPCPGEILKNVRIEPLDLTEWYLSNGVRVILKPTGIKNNEILFKAGSRGGYSLAPDSLSLAASVAASIIEESGVGKFDQMSLQKKLSGKGVHVVPEIDGLTEGMSGQCPPGDMETLFQMIYLYFTSPRKDTTAFLSYKNRIRSFLKNRNARPESAYEDTIQMTMAQYHPRKRLWSNVMLDKLDLDFAYQFYKDRFADASDFMFYFVGSFTINQIKPYILRYIASLPNINRNESWRDVGIEIPKGHIEKTVYRGIETKSRVTMILTGSLTYEKIRKYRFDALMDILHIRLREIIPETPGGAYRVSVSGSLYKFPKETFDIRIAFGCEPDRVDEVTQTIIMQIDTLKRFGPKLNHIQKIQKNHLRSYKINLQKNSYWLNQLYLLDFYGRNRVDMIKYPEWVQSLNTDSLQQLAQRCFGFENYVRVVLYPENRH